MYSLTHLISAFLITTAAAAPQYGYNYNYDYGFRPNERFHHNYQQPLKRSPPQSLPLPLSSPLPSPLTESVDVDRDAPPTNADEPPRIHKNFFLISAEDNVEEHSLTKHLVIGRPQKNYRVVFIKAPSSDSSKVKYTAEFAPQEEKTVIYVLSKKASELEANDIATPAPQQVTKPEVYFIKYKTPEEAAAAQKEIQEQYDQLGGTSDFSDEGTAPVHSVIGSLDDSLDGAASNERNDNKDFKSDNADIDNSEDAVAASIRSRQYLPLASRHY